MFEIRVICDRADSQRITDALSAAFTTGPVREYAAHDGKRVRLYVNADHHTDTESE